LIGAAARQRIDKWLWHARLVRTRVMAAVLVEAGHVRLNGQRITAPGKTIKAGDVVTLRLDGGVRTVKVLGFALRRGSAAEAADLFEPISALPTGDR
jgi:ribosome-associated heat shock protein Hsp15